jgi:ribonuclease VapC
MVIDTSAILAILLDEPVDTPQAQTARGAFSRFGKGRHPAGLNYGDCFSYALATVLGEPLLFKGKDFPLTDVEPFTPPRGGVPP